MKKKISIIGCLLSLCLLLLCPIAVLADGSQIYDYAGILSDSDISRLSEEIDRAETYTGWHICVGTTDDAGGLSTMAYADRLYEECYGINTDGISLVIDLDNRQYYISTSGAATDAINRSTEKILDAGESAISAGNYYGCLSNMLSTAVQLEVESHPHLSFGKFLVALVLGLLGMFIPFGAVKKSYTAAAHAYVYDRHANSRVSIARRADDFVREVVTKRRIDRDRGSSGGGGGGTHVSSGGGTHGGGGRSF